MKVRWILGALLLGHAWPGWAGTSRLWGERGELWDPLGRLPDFSYAGYHAGEAPLPRPAAVASVKDFGAQGDGSTDDTKAFQSALDAASAGALLVPKGRYLLSSRLVLRKSGVVLRGEGSGTGGSILSWSKGLQEVTGARYPWNWGVGGLLRVAPDRVPGLAKAADHPPSADLALGPRLAGLAADARRGDTVLVASGSTPLKTGDYLVLTLIDPPDRSLNLHLHNGQGSNEYNQDMPLHWVVRARRVAGTRIVLLQPLRFDVRAAWKPEIRSYHPVEEVGLEGLRFEFPDRPYPGHQQEAGYNAFAFEGCLNCWARDIAIRNCDNGPSIEELSKHCTVQDLAQLPRATLALNGRISGHHGFSFNINSHDNLLTDFTFAASFIHGVSVGYNASGNVARRGNGTDLNIDHHSRTPFENLYSDIHLGLGAYPWLPVAGAGGDPLRSGARGTAWNIRMDAGPVPPPPFAYAQFNVVGTTRESRTEAREWLETLAPVAPPDLYRSQLDRRLAGAVSLDKPSRGARPLPVTRRSRRRAGAFLRCGGETCREPRAADGRLTSP